MRYVIIILYRSTGCSIVNLTINYFQCHTLSSYYQRLNLKV